MAEFYTRSRRRITPAKKLGIQKIGGFFPAVTTGNPPKFVRWSSTEINPKTYNYQAPYVRAELTLDAKHKGPPFYDGGDFKNLQVTYTEPYDGVFAKGTYVRSDGMEKYVGGFGPPPDSVFGGTDVSNPKAFLNGITFFNDVSAYGVKAWQRCKPKIEFADAYVFLKELKDVSRATKTSAKLMADSYSKIVRSLIPKAMRSQNPGIATRHINAAIRRAERSRMMSPRYVGDQFLNEQFGWLPFLADIRKFNNAYTNFIEINARLSERCNKWRRRKVTVETGDTTTKISSGTGNLLSPGLLGTSWSQYFSVEPTWTVEERTEYVISAVGSWRWYLREFDMERGDYSSEWSRMMRQLDIFGARITPINVYRATPWTWLADWFTDASAYGEYVSDALMQDLAAKYFYVMGHWKITRRFIQNLPLISAPTTLTFERVIETKQRLGAGSPFDFSLSWSSLNPRQLAILSALYVTRK